MIWAEIITILTLGAIVLSCIFKMPPDNAEKIALALGGMLGGYLTKSAVDLLKNAVTKPRQEGEPSQ